MSLFDSILGHAHDHPTLKNMAEKLGIDQEQAEQAIAALGEAHQQQGDTVSLAAERTGLSSETLSRIVEQIGGEGSLGPDLTDAEWLHSDGSLPAITKTIQTGVPTPKKAPAPMPPMGGAALSPEQVRTVAAYVHSLSHGGGKG